MTLASIATSVGGLLGSLRSNSAEAQSSDSMPLLVAMVVVVVAIIVLLAVVVWKH